MAKATPGSLDAQKGKIEKQLQKDVEKGKLAAADLGTLLERLKWTTHLHDLANVDLLIESIVEELPVKRDHFGKLDDIVKDDAIFATNTVDSDRRRSSPRRRRRRRSSSACTSSTPCTR
jgi:3-hydroxybutyryl-CoA dehydrogenase